MSDQRFRVPVPRARMMMIARTKPEIIVPRIEVNGFMVWGSSLPLREYGEMK
jgi:hypothetical protein